VWTGFDYRGEPSPNEWPNISSQYGIIDTCGFPKDSFFYYKSWWTSEPVLHLFPHWNWPGMEGKEIAVWVYSNLDKVELLVNGVSLGTKDMKRESHLAWNVKYAAGAIEARGFKDGKLAMTAKRETTGAAAKLVMNADRREVNADGEDVAMFAVEVQDAQGRVVPITDNEISFKVSGAGTLIGTGNGDPTNQEPDKGTSRKAFGGYCMAIVQATKKDGSITVEASSPGLAPARVTVTSKAVTLRPQAPVWAREVPKGSGVTGLWRPVPGGGATGLMGFLVGNGSSVFSLSQEGSKLTGSVEGLGGGWFGGSDAPTPISEGKVDGNSISFKAGNSVYEGTMKDGQLDLLRKIDFGHWLSRMPKEPAGPRPAIGPPPDGSDPSFNLPHDIPPGIPVVLRRVER
jgi:beta-galactosidase